MIKFSIPFRSRVRFDPFEVHVGKQLARVGIIGNNYPKLYTHVDSVYGFAKPTPLNGGRSNFNIELTVRDIEVAYSNKIKVRVPLTTTEPTIESYEHETSREVLQMLSDVRGGAIVASDELAHWIRKDYPNISIEASAIHDIDTNEKVQEKLKLYNTVCLPVKMSMYKDDIIAGIDNKERVRLFATNECSFNCPKKSCYKMISRMAKNNFLKHDGEEDKMEEERNNYFCSTFVLNKDGTQKYPREDWWDHGLVFDIKHLSELGYDRFKIANGV